MVFYSSNKAWVEQKKKEENSQKNDPLAGRSPAFRRLVSYAMLGSLFKKGVKNAKD